MTFSGLGSVMVGSGMFFCTSCHGRCSKRLRGGLVIATNKYLVVSVCYGWRKKLSHPIIEIYISDFRGHLGIISLLEIDPESCSDQFGGVESYFWWTFAGFVQIFAILWSSGNHGFRCDKPRGLWAAWQSPRLVRPSLVLLNLFRQQYRYTITKCSISAWLQFSSTLKWCCTCSPVCTIL